MSARSRCAAPLLALVLLLLTACSATPRSEWLPWVAPAARPRDPWVLRCVLDGRPRMLVVALDRDLWAAYDTQSCTLARTWRGDVNFDGPVYTTAHGPQPTSRGDDLPDLTVGAAWHVQRCDDDSPGNFALDPQPAAVSFRGHRYVDGHVQLLYALTCPDGSRMSITETIEAAHPNAGGIEFVRQFDTDRWPDWRPLLLGAVQHGEPAPERTAPDRHVTAMNGEGVHRMAWGSNHPHTSRDMFVFSALTCVLAVHHVIDLRVPPRGMTEAEPEAGTVTEAER
jgi:hypothetical protein